MQEKNQTLKDATMPKAVPADAIADAVIEIRVATEKVQALASSVGRGPGGRCLSIAITNMQQGGLWLREAEQMSRRKG